MNYEIEKILKRVCGELDLDFLRIKAFVLTTTYGNPEFRERCGIGDFRVGVMAFPESEAVEYGFLPGDLVLAEKNILAGCERISKLLDKYSAQIIDTGKLWQRVFQDYADGWRVPAQYFKAYRMRLYRLRKEKCEVIAN